MKRGRSLAASPFRFLIETRNGSGLVLKQQVRGVRYMDELVEVSVNADPVGGDACNVHYWAMQYANFNVLGIVDEQGVLVERCE